MDDGSIENVYKEFWFPLQTCNKKAACKQEYSKRIGQFSHLRDKLGYVTSSRASCHKNKNSDQPTK